MDPFSITVGALGITQFAMNSISGLRNVVNSLDEAKDVLQDVTSGLEAIQRPLSALEQLQISDEQIYTAVKEDLESTGVAEAVNKCGQTCARFSEKLEKWTRHSSATKLSLRDRLSIGLWNKENIQTLKTQVYSCQATVQFAVTSAQLIIQVRSENTSKTARRDTEKQMRSLENSIQEHIQLTQRKQAEALQRQNDLENPEDGDDDDGGAQRTLAIQEIKEQARFLEADQTASEILSQVLSKLSTPEAGTQSQTEIRISGNYNGGMVIGQSTGTVNWNGHRS
ncbi:Uncharacterized protein PECH_006338 [Penicillium ucsense]|uniref:Azaphilone pigments biosynthesis cluster protein L N-terminal domain-containing protein n=1 Tax=Penicillium ucsense TaxID=2839758 RepID=A0A8J8W863_9EURO|nr:Uncharacterized protein PECM_001469 [Penicillium ucsense]KAF7739131.1 Uncharacterized protein PECH_006338 [Penicillium ucsense]